MNRQLAFDLKEAPIVCHVCPSCEHEFERVRSPHVIACPICAWRWLPAKGSS